MEDTSLEAWSKTPGASLFDTECWTVARSFSPISHRAVGYVLFTAPVPFRVLAFRRVEDIARYLRKPLDAIRGTVYYDTDWARREAGVMAVS